MRAVFSDWRLVGGFRKTTAPWLTVSTGSDIALNGQLGTQRANQVLDDPYATAAQTLLDQVRDRSANNEPSRGSQTHACSWRTADNGRRDSIQES